MQDFIDGHLQTDTAALMLKGSPFPKLDIRDLVTQIDAKRRASLKLPTWFNTKGIIYPSPLSIEQTSSEHTAAYKASLFKGKLLVDITGGFGVDDYYFAKNFDKVIHCEINEELSEIACNNFKTLSVNNIECHSGSGTALLETTSFADVIYADPARRDDARGKVFLLSDCTPDITRYLEAYLRKCEKLVLKTSPMLDLMAGLRELEYVREIHIVAVKNEVKELLWILSASREDDPVRVTAVNLDHRKADRQAFSCSLSEITTSAASIGEVSNYLYEPHAALMKTGAFNLISQRLKVTKLHQHTHLYTSETLIEFPGRAFKILKTVGYHKKEIKKLLGDKKANISTRNFPETVAGLRKKYKIRDGGELYVFFCTGSNDQKLAILCEKA